MGAESPLTLGSRHADTRVSRPPAERRHLENCIASTRSQSIQYNPSYKGLTMDALALGADEGRGRPRKASVSCQTSVEPGMSEWGNLAGVMPSHSGLNT